MSIKLHSNRWLALTAAGIAAWAVAASAQSSYKSSPGTAKANILGQTALANHVFGHEVRLCFHHFAPIILPYVFGLPSASARASKACSLGG